MKIEMRPATLSGLAWAPPSKSMGHRMLICAGLASGTSVVRGISDSEDMNATLDLLSLMGATYQKVEDVVTIQGIDPRSVAVGEGVLLNCRECGSTLRFFIPLCLLSGHPITLTGSPRLMARPLGVYEDLCREQGLDFEQDTTQNTLTVQGILSGGEMRVRGDVSSQFITGLLFALPLCPQDSILHIIPPLESRPYIAMTLAAMAKFGVSATWMDAYTLAIRGGQTYSPASVTVEGDYSNAAFFHGLEILGHHVDVAGLWSDSLQGDKVYHAFYAQLRGGSPTLDISQCPDLGPVLMALGGALHGVTLTGTRRLRIKESDRGVAMAEELAKFGVAVDVAEDSIVVHSGGLRPPQEVLDGHNDHRIVMALCTIMTLTGGILDGAEAVRKSLPDYFSMLRDLGAEVNILET